MSTADELIREAVEAFGVTPSDTSNIYMSETRTAKRDRNPPIVSEVPTVGLCMIGEGHNCFTIKIGEQMEPAIMVVDRGTDERPPMALYYCPDATQLRAVAAFCIEHANRLDGGAGCQ
ncbi:hypothetical protein [Sphingomonas oligoaromativorans]|uniref:hypothetical protein n=1 Tax=Sphingomonas oligoaromativorans TaxID=575322 RepID=UPI00141F9D62|nr:hypothetical protein [Sphingomonas oligoaromativorans]NIJ34317.1 hypothetical protein [Sphingomonas oligoaromativorans]